EDPTSEAKRRLLARRLGAMADAAHTLDLEQVAPAFTSAQSALERAGSSRTDRAFEDVREILALVPSLCPSPEPAPKSAPTPVLSAQPPLTTASPGASDPSPDATGRTNTARSAEFATAP